jgi:hypothetical protein
VSCLEDADKIELERARAAHETGIVNHLLERARKALSDKGAGSCLEDADKIELERARAAHETGIVNHLLERAHHLLAKKGGEGWMCQKPMPLPNAQSLLTLTPSVCATLNVLGDRQGAQGRAPGGEERYGYGAPENDRQEA